MTKPERQPPRPKKRTKLRPTAARRVQGGPSPGVVAGIVVAVLVAAGGAAFLASGRGGAGGKGGGLSLPGVPSREEVIEERARRWAAQELRPRIQALQRARGEVDQAGADEAMRREVERQRPGSRLLEDCYDLAAARAREKGGSVAAWRAAVEKVWIHRGLKAVAASSGGKPPFTAEQVLERAADEVAAVAVEERALDSLDR